VFYSGRDAFRSRGAVYVLGFNPGGDPKTHDSETVRKHTQFVLSKAPDKWSAYCDERWKQKQFGAAPLQQRVKHLLSQLRLDARETPSSNLIFTRSRRAALLNEKDKSIEEACWPFHQTVLDMLRPRAIICLGNETGKRVRNRVAANQLVDTFTENNDRRWISTAHSNGAGLIVFSLTHPAIADWKSTSTDPVAMVCRTLAL
jgi:hypothetical protein